MFALSSFFRNRERYDLVVEETKMSRKPRWAYYPILKSFLLTFLPTWISCFIFRSEANDSQSSHPLSSTAWLDGLRGVAAFVVSIYHFTKDYPNFYNNPFFAGPYTEQDGNPMAWTSPLQLPIIRLIYSGQAMVPIFFVISGYVLSFRKIEAIRKQDFEKLSSLVFSSSIRRGFRLYPPVFATYILVHTESLFIDRIPGVPTPPSLTELITRIIERSCLAVSQIFKIDVYEGALWQFWTIPIEFTDSIILFAVAMGISRMTVRMRICSVLAIAFTALFSGCWGVFLFLFGWVIAECEAMWSPGEHSIVGKKSSYHNAFWICCLVVGCILAGYPCQNVDHDILLRHLPSITPKVYKQGNYHTIWYFWIAVSAPFIVWPIFRIPSLQNIFTWKFTRYLGKISYALYAVHYQVMFLNEKWIRAISVSFFGNERDTHFKMHGAVILELLIFEFLVLWQADVFLRLIDIPTIKFAKWVEKQVRSC